MAQSLAIAADGSATGHGVPVGEAFRVWTRVAMLSFGGPAGQIAVMHRILVEEKHWISEERFLHALNYCMLLPGPEAHELAIYIGWLLHRVRGGLIAGILFVLPGLVTLTALSLIYAEFGNIGIVQALFFGLKAAVLAVVLEAVVRVGKRALKSRGLVAIAALAFVGIFAFGLPFPLIVIAAGYTDTAMAAAVPPEILEKIVARIPVGRLARPAEIASAVIFLVSDGAAFITGETLCVNGGQYLQ